MREHGITLLQSLRCCFVADSTRERSTEALGRNDSVGAEVALHFTYPLACWSSQGLQALQACTCP